MTHDQAAELIRAVWAVAIDLRMMWVLFAWLLVLLVLGVARDRD